jgi:hypothetical protein
MDSGVMVVGRRNILFFNVPGATSQVLTGMSEQVALNWTTRLPKRK